MGKYCNSTIAHLIVEYVHYFYFTLVFVTIKRREYKYFEMPIKFQV
jgi:hypothetical protein